jgi:hypothetical protein
MQPVNFPLVSGGMQTIDPAHALAVMPGGQDESVVWHFGGGTVAESLVRVELEAVRALLDIRDIF